MRPDIIGYGAEIFADGARIPCLLQDNAQVFFAFTPISFTIFRCRIIARREVGRAAASSFQHLIPIEREKVAIFARSPGKGIDPVETEDVIDTKKMETAPHAPGALAPPIEILLAHRIPAKKRNAPVLSPFLGELVVLEIRFRRRPTAPIQPEFIAARKNIRAVITDAEWNVAHESDLPLFRVGFDRR